MLTNTAIQNIPPRKALNAAFLKLKPYRDDIEKFKTYLTKMLDSLNSNESEEFHKNLIISFLKSTYYQGKYAINTKGRNDLVIHNDKSHSSKVGVIIEAKRPTNTSEMASVTDLNCKAMQELVLYYLRERISENNLELKHLIITNLNEWFIFDVTEFEKYFAENKNLVSNFNKFQDGLLSGKNTDFFYKSVASPEINEIKGNIKFTHFNFNDYKEPLVNESKTDDKKLISLYKLLSPEHLLKLPFANDSNSLDKQFYGELLHIIGLNEVKKSGKKLIQRAKKGDRNHGSLLENTITQVDSLDKLRRFMKRSEYGEDVEEQLFNVGLELCITWINRILFLKLLEAQLLTYHKNSPEYEFLNFKKLKDYDDLNKLFFRVLAKKSNERNPEVQKLFNLVPYLNSSLFEPSEIEQDLIFISNLDDDCTIPYYRSTVLKDSKGRKRKGELNAIEYLFDFLSAYDFSSEGAEEIQEENKTLINASVLGLIFEKINGYKDGSFFTPGFITMYMCKETIRKAVLQKFKDVKSWDLSDFDALYNKVSGFYETKDILEVNNIINSITICDPAVGSGHFLVSALNEILSIKSELEILCDSKGRKLNTHKIFVENDELVVVNNQNQLFEYIPNNDESQRVQETLFKEKQTIIENCLFGVDINPNSVKICRLRLWIELLKNAYYRPDGELETLPNIDINIKCGNSLVSRFSLDSDLKKALKNTRHSIEAYQAAINTYSHAKDKQQKNEMRDLINEIKNSFKNEIIKDHQVYKDLEKFEGQLVKLTKQVDVFGFSEKQEDEFNKKVALKVDAIEKQKKKIEHLENNKIYDNAFEWRFEFPEVLNNDGDFIGFDAVIGNPPYIKEYSNRSAFEGLYNNECYQGKMDLWYFFGSLAFDITKIDGYISYIAPNNWITNAGASNFRDIVLNKGKLINFVDFGGYMVFDSASIQTMIYLIKSTNDNAEYTLNYSKINDKNVTDELAQKFLKKAEHKQFKYYDATIKKNEMIGQSIHFIDSNILNIIKKITKAKNFGFDKKDIAQGIVAPQDYLNKINQTKLGEGYIVGQGIFNLSDKEYKELNLTTNEKSLVKPFYTSKELSQFAADSINKYWVIYTDSKFQHAENIQPYPNLKKHLDQFERIITSDFKPYGLHRSRDERFFKGEKIMSLRKCAKPTFTFTDFDCYVSQSYFVIKTDQMDLKFLTGLLNSHLMTFWLKHKGKMQGEMYQVDKGPLMELPIHKPANELQLKIAKIVDEIIHLKQSQISDEINMGEKLDNLIIKLNQEIYRIYDIQDEMISTIESNLKFNKNL